MTKPANRHWPYCQPLGKTAINYHILDDLHYREYVMAPQEFDKMTKEIVSKLVRDYNPEKIILYGSYASGNYDDDSDIDLLIIKETDDRFIDRWVAVRKILTDRNRKIPLEPLVLTPHEISSRLERGDQFIAEILDKGKLLYAA